MSFRLIFFGFLLLYTTVSAAPLCPVAQNTSSLASDTKEVRAEVETKQGWTSEPDGRGTFDILWSCGFTMFLSSWSVLCLNVPGPDDGRFQVFRRKLYMTTLAFLGPEFIFQIALGQLVSARRSVKDFHTSGYKQWTLTHAFYADMGGYILHTPDWVPFPVDAKQLHFLVTEGYVKFPETSTAHIRDKNKVDGLLRILTVSQILWFIVNMAARAAQNLVITCGELTTAAFIVCSVGTTVCWIYKPADVTTSEIVETDTSIAEILLKAGDRASEPYSRTPLDFVSRNEWPWSLYWSNWINILRNLGIVFGPRVRPVYRFENTIYHELPGAMNYVFLGMSALYIGIFICGWNYSFPTHTEKILWRAAGITLMGTLVGLWGFTQFAFTVYPAIKRRLSKNGPNNLQSESTPQQQKTNSNPGYFTSKAKSVAACIRNNSVTQDPALHVPLKAMLPLYVVGVFYCHARTYIFVADIIQLRSLPSSAYSTVNWIQLIPHF